MKQLWQDIRAHPLPTAAVIALWGLATWFVALEPTACAAAVLLAPAVAASVLIGRAHRLPEPPYPGVAIALLIGVLLFDLSVLALYLAGHAGEFDPSLPREVQVKLMLFVTVLGDLFVVLPACIVGWLLGSVLGCETVEPGGAAKSAW